MVVTRVGGVERAVSAFARNMLHSHRRFRTASSAHARGASPPRRSCHMADKKKGAKEASATKGAPAAKLRDLDMLDSKVKNVKGGAKRTIRSKRTAP